MILCITTGAALSVTDSDDDYGIIYTVTMVNARSCARPSRSPHQPCNEGLHHIYTLC